MGAQDFDIAILGGGLAGGLAALALVQARPGLKLALVEAEARFGGNHVWSFFASDLDADAAALVEPLVAARWDAGYDVAFPAYARTLATPYRAVTSDRLDAALRRALPDDAHFAGRRVTEAGARHCVLADGTRLTAGAVIDARGWVGGWAGGLPGMGTGARGGWQKFVGRMLRLAAPHGLTRPVVMDARVDQHDGFRFVYCLPFAADIVFVEDTYYADAPTLDRALLAARIDAWCAARGWTIAAVLNEETGVLPVIGAIARPAPTPAGAPVPIGTRAGLCHPLTSYSLPVAAQVALALARLPDLSYPALAQAAAAIADAHWRSARYYRLLTRLMFGASRAEGRYRMLEHFYRKPQAMIERFYAGRSTGADRLRLFAGRPPVPVLAALAVMAGGGAPLSPLDGSAA